MVSGVKAKQPPQAQGHDLLVGLGFWWRRGMGLVDEPVSGTLTVLVPQLARDLHMPGMSGGVLHGVRERKAEAEFALVHGGCARPGQVFESEIGERLLSVRQDFA